jgi:hypothetical protein
VRSAGARRGVSGPLRGAVGPRRQRAAAAATAVAPEVASGLRADGSGGSGGSDDGCGRWRGWGSPFPLALPRLPGRRVARGLRGRHLRGARHRQPDVSLESRPEPGAGSWHAGQREDRWAGRPHVVPERVQGAETQGRERANPGARGDEAVLGCPQAAGRIDDPLALGTQRAQAHAAFACVAQNLCKPGLASCSRGAPHLVCQVACHRGRGPVPSACPSRPAAPASPAAPLWVWLSLVPRTPFLPGPGVCVRCPLPGRLTTRISARMSALRSGGRCDASWRACRRVRKGRCQNPVTIPSPV